jgi:hypothetical protein
MIEKEGELKQQILNIPGFYGKNCLAVLKILGEAAKEFRLALDSNEYEKLVKKWFG